MNTLIRRTLLLSAAIVPLASSLASAQYRVDNGNARDANNRIGSGGYNDARADPALLDKRIGGLAGNYIVTGNVTGGRSFRGQVGYTDASSFRGQLGSASFDSFIRDSTGVSQIRGGYGANNGLSPRPFFGNNTVTPPPGFVRSSTNNGTYAAAGTAPVLPNDGRADYGGASRAQVTQSLIDDRQQSGNAGLTPVGSTPYGGQYGQSFGDANFGGISAPLQLSEFTTLARQRRDLFGGAVDESGRIDMQATKTVGTNSPSNPFDTTRNAPNLDRNAPAVDPNDFRSPNAAPLDARPPLDPDAKPGDTGQSLSRVPTGGTALENNSQYAQLRNRLAQARGKTASGMANEPGQAIGGPISTQTVGAGTAVSTGQGRIDTPAPVTEKKPDDAAGPNANPNAMPGDATAKPGDRATGDRPTDRATGDRATDGRASPNPIPNTSASDAPAPQDNLNLPRPDGMAGPAGRPAAAAPVQIQSLSSGVKDPKLAKVLTQAEEMMKAGKFGSAIDLFERAEEIATDDPLVFVGRSIAELGGGYFRNAEVHLRQAFAADESLLYAKFDLRSMLGDDRLNQLATKLGDVANKNPNDPGPLMLLAFIYYNGGMEDKAARALDMAQVRANGKDKEVEALRKTWTLDAPPADMNK